MLGFMHRKCILECLQIQRPSLFKSTIPCLSASYSKVRINNKESLTVNVNKQNL